MKLLHREQRRDAVRQRVVNRVDRCSDAEYQNNRHLIDMIANTETDRNTRLAKRSDILTVFELPLSLHLHFRLLTGRSFLRATAVPAGTAEARISYGHSVRLSRPGGIPSPGEIETPGLHHMIA